MSVLPYKSLQISGKYYSETELREFIKQASIGKIPQWKASLFAFIEEWLSDSLKVKVKTSGSTGPARWIEVEKNKMATSALMTGRYFNLIENDTALLCLPVHYIAGKMMVVRAFVLGLNLFPIEPMVNPIKEVDISFDFAAMTPMQVYTVLEEKNGTDKLCKIQTLIIGGGAIDNALSDRIKNLDNTIYHTYGMTETLTHVAVKKLTGAQPDIFYKALPGISFSKDNRNCLVISAPHLSEKQFITNDIVHLVDNKTFDVFGRFDNIINSGGIKINPERIEQKLSAFISNRFIICGKSDKKLGQKLVLIIEGKEKPKIDLEKIYEDFHFPKYEIPKEIFFLDKFPETESGKIIRQQVLKRLSK